MSLVDQRAEDLRMDVGALLGAVLSRWLRIFVVTAVLLVAVAGLLLFVPKVYESSASLLVEQRDNVYTRAANELPASNSGASADALMSSQIELIKSRDLLLAVIDSEKLRSVPEFSGVGFSPTGFVMNLMGRKTEPKSIDETVLANLQDRMTVIRERDSSVISVYVRSTDPALAARIANAIAAAHVKRRAAQSIADTADATVWLQQEIDTLRTKVQAAETSVANYKIENDLFMGANATPVTDQQLSTVSTQIAEAQQRKNAAQARADLISSLVDSGQSLEGIADVRDSVVIQSLLQTKGNLQSELAQKSTTLLANHPTIKALKAQIREIGNQITDEGRKVASSLAAEAKVEGDLEQKLRDDLTRAKLASSDATKGSVTLDSLEREAKAQRDLLENYLAKYSDAMSRTASNSALPDVRIISEAAPASEPASPKIPLILGAVGFVALALQIGVVLFAELMSGRALTWRESDEQEPEMAEPEMDTPDMQELDAGASENLEPEFQFDLKNETAADAQPINDEIAAVRPRPPQDELSLLTTAVAGGKVRTILVAGLSNDDGDRVSVIDRLVDAALDAGLSAVAVDAGSGSVSMDVGLTDLSAERADYGDAVQRVADNLGQVKWGRLAAIDRRSTRPMLLIEALADIYHLVVVDTGSVGMASSLPVFAGSNAPVVLVSDGVANPLAIAATRREIAALGLDIGSVVTVPGLRADVA